MNVRGVFLGTQAAARRMRDTERQGRILNTASISSDLAQTTQSMYDATKAAVKMLTRTAAIELQQYDIRVNAVAPAGVDTDIVPEDAPPKDGPDGDKPVPMGRSAAPEELTGAYLFLASDDAAYVTGETLYVDGGYSVF